MMTFKNKARRGIALGALLLIGFGSFEIVEATTSSPLVSSATSFRVQQTSSTSSSTSSTGSVSSMSSSGSSTGSSVSSSGSSSNPVTGIIPNTIVTTIPNTFSTNPNTFSTQFTIPARVGVCIPNPTTPLPSSTSSSTSSLPATPIMFPGRHLQAAVENGSLRATRSRSLNGYFACGNTHCVSDKATCEVDDAGIGSCTCMGGYGGDLCEPVDECATAFPCPGGSVCVDMFPPMKFKCACKAGFTPFLPNELPDEPGVPLEYRPLQCIDVIECAAEESPCHPMASCTNTIGGFECLCNEGLIGNGITSCEEPVDTTGSITEAPPDGFCSVSTDCQGSNMDCVDSKCVCLPGYALVGPNCQNEEHCDMGGFNNDCHRRATCTEEDGFPGFSCSCIDGWKDAFEDANGKSCVDIPPATEAPPGPITETARPEGVGPFPSRPTVFPPQCLADGTTCGDGIATDCCGTCAFPIDTTGPVTSATTVLQVTIDTST